MISCKFIAPLLTLASVAYAQNACDAGVQTIGTLAGAAPALSTLVQAVQAANMTDVLNTPGPIDVFAPTDTAFANLLTLIGASSEDLFAQTALLKDILAYHVVTEGAVCSGDLSGVVTTASGANLTVDGSTILDGSGNTAGIFGSISAGNGMIYIIDSVLLPLEID